MLARWRGNLGYPASILDDGGEGEDLPSGCPDVRLNPDAGNFLCGFMYYNSLAVYHESKGDERPVVFCHVPDLSHSLEKFTEGRGAIIALIQALVESRRIVGVRKVVRDGSG